MLEDEDLVIEPHVKKQIESLVKQLNESIEYKQKAETILRKEHGLFKWTIKKWFNNLEADLLLTNKMEELMKKDGKWK